MNKILGSLGLPEPLWFNDPMWAKPSLVLIGLWGIGDLMIIFLASLLDVPTEQYEAAALDGVNPRQRFRYVTLPTISPVLMFAALTGVIQTLQYFTEAMVAASVASGQATTGGGSSSLLGYPEGSTLTFAQWIYQQGFRNFYLGLRLGSVRRHVRLRPRLHDPAAAPLTRARRRTGGRLMATTDATSRQRRSRRRPWSTTGRTDRSLAAVARRPCLCRRADASCSSPRSCSCS